MKPEKVYELAKQCGSYEPFSYDNRFRGVIAFEPDDLMSFAIALIEKAHLQNCEREFHLDV